MNTSLRIFRFPALQTFDGRSLTVLGVGAIGSAFVALATRMPGVARIICVDCDAYEGENVGYQQIRPRYIGHAKALMQAKRVRSINPSIDATAIVGRLEDAPLGALRSDVLVCCCDKRIDRVHTNEIASNLGVPWIDLGVSAEHMLARANVYVPGDEQPCYECSLSDQDYAALEHRYACGSQPRPAATRAPIALGAMAAALGAGELSKLIADPPDRSFAGKQVMMDLASRKCVVTSFRRNPACRHDRRSLPTPQRADISAKATVEDLFRLNPAARDENTELAVVGHGFQRMLVCQRCGWARPALRLAGRSRRRADECSRCRGPLVPHSAGLQDRLTADTTTARERAVTLRRLGCMPGDVIRVKTARGDAYYELEEQR